MMNKLILFVSIVAISFLGCKKIDKLTQFNMEFNDTATIPSSTGVNLPFNVLTPDVETNSTSTFKANNTRKDLIEEVSLSEIDLTINSPSGRTFSFLKSINIYINADGLSETKIAYYDSVPQNAGGKLNLYTTGANLKEYLTKDEYSLRINAVTDEIISPDYEINIHSVFFVDAKVLGI